MTNDDDVLKQTGSLNVALSVAYENALYMLYGILNGLIVSLRYTVKHSYRNP